jgi:hypothetical protein
MKWREIALATHIPAAGAVICRVTSEDQGPSVVHGIARRDVARPRIAIVGIVVP